MRDISQIVDEAQRVRRRGEPPEPMRVGDQLQVGETLITAVGVTAQVVVRGGVAAGQFVRLDEQSAMEVVSADAQAPRLKIHKGRLWFSSALSGQRLTLEVGERAKIQPLGTEYAVAVQDPEAGDDFSLVMLDGEAAVSVSGREERLGPMWQGTWESSAGQWRSGELHPTDPTAAMVTVNQQIQWALYYPAVLNLDELPERIEKDPTLTGSAAAYRRGNLLTALKVYPRGSGGPGKEGLRAPVSESEQLYQAALLMSVGRVEAAEALLGIGRELGSRQFRPSYLAEDGDAARQEPRPTGAQGEALARPEPRPTGGEPTPGGPAAGWTDAPSHEARLAHALRVVLAAVLRRELERPWEPRLATEWLAESYYQQSRVGRRFRGSGEAWERERYRGRRLGLERALVAARQAAARGGDSFSFAAVRVAELEFSFGEARKAEEAMEPALRAGPENAQAWALQGFLWSARNRIGRVPHAVEAVGESDPPKVERALDAFNRAIALDPRLGNGWLGRGLCHFHQGQVWAGVQDLERAVAAEPNRSLLRSYLGKAYDEAARELGRYWGAESRGLRRELSPPAGGTRTAWLEAKAADQLAVAERLDPGDPSSRLYAALLKQRQNRINEAITELEASKERNGNRMLFRSEALLDQDQAVRGANLAAIYRDAGMRQVSVREANQAVASDYANYSAHLFLANSYDALRDPRQVNLRYESPWFSEFLLAKLLAPVGAGTLSQTVSNGDYGKLFERDHLGVVSETLWTSNGDWTESGAQYGVFGDFEYAFDAHYRSESGQRVNDDLDQLTLSLQAKAQFGAADTLLVQGIYYQSESGDLAQYYDPGDANPDGRLREVQEPIALVGWRHDWKPGVQTLFAAIPWVARASLADPAQQPRVGFVEGDGSVTMVTDNVPRVPMDYHLTSRGGSAELQQLWQTGAHTVVAGGRYQAGEFDAEAHQDAGAFLGSADGQPVGSHGAVAEFERISAYAYDQWRILPGVVVMVGVTYDRLQAPVNFTAPPLTDDTDLVEQVSPKAGLTVTPWKDGVLRAAYARSLGGVSFDQSFRLEPVQVAGFLQSYRGLLPESLTGLVPGQDMETWGVSLEQRLPSRTYLALGLHQATSDADQGIGAYLWRDPEGFVPDTLTETLDYRERGLLASAHQLVAEYLTLGLTYRLTESELDSVLVDVNNGSSAQRSILHEVVLGLRFNHPSGFFGSWESVWTQQSNQEAAASLDGDRFSQHHVWVGWRFGQRRAELALGVLNLTDTDYRLYPLNPYPETYRNRTFAVSGKLSF